MSSSRQAERCGRRAAELITAGDVILVDDTQAAALQVLLAALSPEILSDVQMVIPDTASHAPTVCMVVARSGALDGSLICSATAATCAKYAADRAIPIYALLAGGPQAHTAQADVLLPESNEAVLTADQINAIVTDRGIYRPAMIARHLNDGDTPLDVIVLRQ